MALNPIINTVNNPINNVYILGLGALGGLYAAKLYDLSPGMVKIIAGPQRIAALRDSGIIINGKPYSFDYIEAGAGSTRASGPDTPNSSPPGSAHPPADLILIAVKYPQLEQAILDMGPFIGRHTIVLSLLNGISSEEIIGQAIGASHLLYAYGLGMDAVRQGNTIQYANAGRIIFGEKHNEVLSERVRSVSALFEKANIPHHIPVNMEKALWAKFMMNTGINQVSAVLRAPYGVFRQEGEARRLVVAAAEEVLALSGSIGIGLQREDVTEFLRILDTLHPNGKTSMLQDIEAGRKSEVELFAGTVIRLGEKYKVATPVNETLYRIIRAMEEMHTR